METGRFRKFSKRYGLALIGCWSGVLVLLTLLTLYYNHVDTLSKAQKEARDYFHLNLLYRAWAAKMGGIYVPDGKVQPNPYLNVSDRDLLTSDGRRLVMINPAYMTRMVFDSMAASPSRIVCRLTSLKPLNPSNTPDPWERQSLKGFERKLYLERSEVTTLGGKPFLRLISAFLTEESCLKCHAHQGYKKGDVRGGITISIPLAPYLELEKVNRQRVVGGYLVLWTLGSFGVAVFSRRQSIHEELLRESERKFRTVCDWTQDWEYWIAPDGTMIYMSPSCAELTGYSAQDFMDDPELMGEILHPDDRLLFSEHWRDRGQAGSGPQHNIEVRIIHRSGEVRVMQHLCRPVFDGESFLGRRVSNRDITEQKAALEQLRQSQKMEAIGQLAGGMAHDFNNILTVIIGYANLIQVNQGLDDKARDMVGSVLSAAEKAAQLTRGLLAFSRRQVMFVQRVDLNDIVANVHKLLHRMIGEDIQFKCVQSQSKLTVRVDSSQIEQVLINLATNARDAMGNGGLLMVETSLEILSEPMEHPRGMSKSGRYACVSVSDSGKGMDAATRTRIFEPFFTTKEKGKGTGLGMAIVYGIVSQHDGFIHVYSEPGLGTTFRVYLPLNEGEPESLEASTPLPVAPRGNETVLVVEDDENVRTLVVSLLAENGYSVIEAGNGREAVKRFAASSGIISLILMDMIMPIKGGREAFDEIRALSPNAKVLFTSGYTEDFIQDRGIVEDGIELIMKPIRPSELLQKVRDVLDA